MPNKIPAQRNIIHSLFEMLQRPETQYLTLAELRRWNEYIANALRHHQSNAAERGKFVVAAYQGDSDSESFVMEARLVNVRGREIIHLFYTNEDGKELRVNIYEAKKTLMRGRRFANNRSSDNNTITIKELCEHMGIDHKTLTFAIFPDYANEHVAEQTNLEKQEGKETQEHKSRKKRKPPRKPKRKKRTKNEIKAKRQKAIAEYTKSLEQLDLTLNEFYIVAAKLLSDIYDQYELSNKTRAVFYAFVGIIFKFLDPRLGNDSPAILTDKLVEFISRIDNERIKYAISMLLDYDPDLMRNTYTLGAIGSIYANVNMDAAVLLKRKQQLLESIKYKNQYEADMYKRYGALIKKVLQNIRNKLPKPNIQNHIISELHQKGSWTDDRSVLSYLNILTGLGLNYTNSIYNAIESILGHPISKEILARIENADIVVDLGAGSTPGKFLTLYSILNNTPGRPLCYAVDPAYSEKGDAQRFVDKVFRPAELQKLQAKSKTDETILPGFIHEYADKFKESVDVIISVYALDKIDFKRNPDEVRRTIDAILSILKPGGVAYLGPFAPRQAKQIKAILKQSNTKHTIREIKVSASVRYAGLSVNLFIYKD